MQNWRETVGQDLTHYIQSWIDCDRQEDQVRRDTIVSLRMVVLDAIKERLRENNVSIPYQPKFPWWVDELIPQLGGDVLAGPKASLREMLLDINRARNDAQYHRNLRTPDEVDELITSTVVSLSCLGVYPLTQESEKQVIGSAAIKLGWTAAGHREIVLERYVNSELGFSTWLPVDWEIIEEDEHVIVLNDSHCAIIVQLLSKETGEPEDLTKAVRDFLVSEGHEVYGLQQLKVDNKQSVKAVCKSKEYRHDCVVVDNGELALCIEMIADNDVILYAEGPVLETVLDGLRVFEPVVSKPHNEVVTDILEDHFWLETPMPGGKITIDGKIPTEKDEQFDVDLIVWDDKQQIRKFAVVARPATTTMRKLEEWKKLAAWHPPRQPPNLLSLLGLVTESRHFVLYVHEDYQLETREKLHEWVEPVTKILPVVRAYSYSATGEIKIVD